MNGSILDPINRPRTNTNGPHNLQKSVLWNGTNKIFTLLLLTFKESKFRIHWEWMVASCTYELHRREWRRKMNINKNFRLSLHITQRLFYCLLQLGYTRWFWRKCSRDFFRVISFHSEIFQSHFLPHDNSILL